MSKVETEQAAQIEALKAQLVEATAKASTATPIKCKVSPKGAVSVYGLQRFPVTLYGNQWQRVLVAERDKLLAFIKANDSKLAKK